MKRRGKSLTKARLLMPSDGARRDSVRVYPKLWDCSALKWHNEVNAYDSSLPADLLQDKEALIKRSARGQNVRKTGTAAPSRNQELRNSVPARKTRGRQLGAEMLSDGAEARGLKVRAKQQDEETRCCPAAQRRGEMQPCAVVHCPFRREMGRGPDGTMQSLIRVFLRAQKKDLKWCLI